MTKRRKRHNPEQIVRKLRDADAMLNAGKDLATVLGIRYREDQRQLEKVTDTDPSDLFLHGVMDSRRGTCANMAALHVAIGWRLGWPVSLACVGSHFICRFDDGRKAFNNSLTPARA